MRKHLQKAFKNEHLTSFPHKPIIGYHKIHILRRERIMYTALADGQAMGKRWSSVMSALSGITQCVCAYYMKITEEQRTMVL